MRLLLDYVEIGKRIAARRRVLGLKQTQVCERCDINNNYLSNIERARSIPSLDVMMRICIALDTTPDAILLGTAHPTHGGATGEEVCGQVKTLSARQLALTKSFLQWLVQQRV